MDGKAMIVCMSRRICVDLYNELVALRPEWHGADDETGALRLVAIEPRLKRRGMGRKMSEVLTWPKT